MEIRENVKFSFTPEFKITEGIDGDSKWLQIGGTALTEGVSKNKRAYSVENLNENNGKEFKWLFGHPSQPEEHIVGLGGLNLDGDNLMHEGKIRNTSRHPDVVEMVRDGLLGPSIHASAEKVTRKDGAYHMEGLSIDGIGLVAFQGVKNASIDYAIAESFDKMESIEDAKENKDNEGDIMSEEEKTEETPKEEEAKVEEPVAEEPKEESKEEVKAEESSELDSIKEELRVLKESNKKKIVESIMTINKELKADDLMKESEDKLEMIKEYESKLSSKSEPTAIVEEDEAEKTEEIVEEQDGSFSISEATIKKFNSELMERVK